jgi:hypothetical protein
MENKANQLECFKMKLAIVIQASSAKTDLFLSLKQGCPEKISKF